MGCKGQATTAVFRSSVFQTYFLGLAKLIAAKSLAPEPGRYTENMIKNIAISTYLIALTLFAIFNVLVSLAVDATIWSLLEIYVDIVLILGGFLLLRGVHFFKWVFLAAPAVFIQVYLTISNNCSYTDSAIWLLCLSPLFFLNYQVSFSNQLGNNATSKEIKKSGFKLLISCFLIPIFILMAIASVYIFSGGGRYYFYLPFASKIALKYEANDLAKSYANEMLRIANNENSDWNKGNAIFSGNIILGRLALKDGKIKEASTYLIKAGKTPGSPQLNSFGPGMGLARDLLEKGEVETVIQYLKFCKEFWELDNGQLDQWLILIKNGEIPNFPMNSNYY